MKFRLAVLALIAGFLSINVYSQSKAKPVITNYSLKFKVGGLKDVDAYLGFHYGDKKYIKDTAHVNSNGEIEFTGKDTLEGGIYLFITPSKNFFEFVVNEPKIQLETDTLDLTGHVVVKKSAENTVWFEYMRTIAKMQKDMQPFNEVISKADVDKESKEYKDAIAGRDKVTESLNKFREDQIKKNPDMLVSTLFKAMKDVDMKAVEKDTDKVKVANYFKEHYWDNVDLSDSRLIRTPVLESKITHYFDKVCYQIPDSLMIECDRILKKTNGDKEMFKFILHHLTYVYERSQIMCMDAVFVHLVDTYYKTGQTPWVEQKTMEKMLERAEKLRPNLCGKQVVNISLPDTGGVFHSLYDFKGDYTILFFWDATCSHCKKSTPVLADLYKTYLKPNGIEIFGVEGELDDKEWKKYQAEQNLPWLNVSDNPEMNANPEKWILELKKTDLNSLNFRHIFDLYSYPVVFVLDKQKRIIGKKLGVEQIQDFIEKYKKVQERKEKEKK